jgi:hypothetical protein
LLRVHDATVIDADYGYFGGSKITGSIKLKAGLHPFRLYYMRIQNKKGNPILNLEWSGPGFETQLIPSSNYYRK